LVARLDIWVSSLKAIEDNFFTGIGIGTFNKIIPVRYPYQTVGLSFDVSQSHNLFLDVAVSTGIPGLIGLLLLFAGVVLMAARALHGDLVARLVALGVLASMTAFVVYGLTDSMAFSRPTSFIIWLWPCALALVQPRSSGERTTT
jgi:O-antigen ligase